MSDQTPTSDSRGFRGRLRRSLALATAVAMAAVSMLAVAPAGSAGADDMGGGGEDWEPRRESRTFYAAPGMQTRTWTAPEGATNVTFEANGGGGGQGAKNLSLYSPGEGGDGTRVIGTITRPDPGETFTIELGSGGKSGHRKDHDGQGGSSPYGSGGSGGDGTHAGGQGGGGGGATAIKDGTDRYMIVAAGGGGGGGAAGYGSGGAGSSSHENGESGKPSLDNKNPSGFGGKGFTDTTEGGDGEDVDLDLMLDGPAGNGGGGGGFKGGQGGTAVTDADGGGGGGRGGSSVIALWLDSDDEELTAGNGGTNDSDGDGGPGYVVIEWDEAETTTTTLTATSGSATLGAPITMTAGVERENAVRVAEGTVQFYEKVDEPIGDPVPVDEDGIAQIVVNPTDVDLTVRAEFTPASGESYLGSSGTYTFDLWPEDTETTVEVVPFETFEGTSVEVQVEVTARSEYELVPAGPVDVYLDGDLVGSTSLDEHGRASVTIEDVPAGALEVEANFRETGNYYTSWGSVPLSVSSRDTEVDLRGESSASTPELGDEVTFEAMVTPVGPNPPEDPTGQVQFLVDGDPLGDPVDLDGSGTADYSTSSLPAGTNDVTAEYLGDDEFGGSASDVFEWEVDKGEVEITYEASTEQSGSEGTPTFTVTVTPERSGVTQVPSGTAMFFVYEDDTTAPGDFLTLDENGMAEVEWHALDPGPHAVMIVYSGDDNFHGADVDLDDYVVDEPGPALLRVETSPPVASTISVDGDWSDTWAVNGLEVDDGSHEVCFSDVAGFATPECETVEVEAGDQATVVGEFVERGWLQVETSPAVASRISIDGNPANNWGVFVDLDEGDHEVCFGAVEGFDPPECQTVEVTAGETTELTGEFDENPEASGLSDVGQLRVQTSPAVASRISVDGRVADTWGLDWLELDPGDHEVCFSDVAGFVTPDCETVTVSDGQVTEVTGEFVELGYLQVNTDPADVGSQIRVDGIYRDGWGLFTQVPVGAHEVCFTDVAGPGAPGCETVEVSAGGTATVTGDFGRDF